MMNERSAKARKKARRQTQEEGIEAAIESLYHSNKGRLVALAKADTKEKSGTPEWQKNVALATNTAGAAAGPAAIWMAVRQAKGKGGGMPRQAVEAVESKTKPTTRTGRVARRAGKALRNPKAVAVGGAAAIGAQVANTSGDVIAARFLAEDKKKGKAMANMSKSLSNNGLFSETAVTKKDKKDRTGTAIATSTGAGALLGGTGGAYLNHVLNDGRKVGFSEPQILNRLGKEKLGEKNMRALRFLEMKRDPVGVSRRAVRRMPGKAKWALGGAALLGTSSGMATAADRVGKADGQSLISKSDPVFITGHGKSLVEKRNFNAEADRQRRLGVYTGAGLGAGLVLGDAARRRAPIKAVELKDGTKRKIVDFPRGKRGRLTLAALAAGSVASTAGGVAAYRRGISERNNAYL